MLMCIFLCTHLYADIVDRYHGGLLHFHEIFSNIEEFPHFFDNVRDINITVRHERLYESTANPEEIVIAYGDLNNRYNTFAEQSMLTLSHVPEDSLAGISHDYLSIDFDSLGFERAWVCLYQIEWLPQGPDTLLYSVHVYPAPDDLINVTCQTYDPLPHIL